VTSQAIFVRPSARFDGISCSPYVPAMAAANASARGQRAAILASSLPELTGVYLGVYCLAPRTVEELQHVTHASPVSLGHH
jgi:hypothetical protein